jgi:GT2 family glycosyltransferase
MKKISIIIPTYKLNEKLFNKLKKYLNTCSKDYEIIIVDGKNGLANAYNNGINMAGGDILITIHQDCIPCENDSIDKLISPLISDPKVIMSYSKIFDYETKRNYYPTPPDGKFVAYRKTSLKKIGMFDEKSFFSGGEDVDIFLKLKKVGKIAKVDTTAIHYHKGYLGNKTVEKRKQNGNINGALFRIWGIQNPKWFFALLFCLRYPKTYGKYFIHAFIAKKQEYRRKSK